MCQVKVQIARLQTTFGLEILKPDTSEAGDDLSKRVPRWMCAPLRRSNRQQVEETLSELSWVSGLTHTEGQARWCAGIPGVALKCASSLCSLGKNTQTGQTGTNSFYFTATLM